MQPTAREWSVGPRLGPARRAPRTAAGRRPHRWRRRVCELRRQGTVGGRSGMTGVGHGTSPALRSDRGLHDTRSVALRNRSRDTALHGCRSTPPQARPLGSGRRRHRSARAGDVGLWKRRELIDEFAAFGQAPQRAAAGENFWGSVATQLGGSQVSVKSVVYASNADPHDYQSNTSTARAFATADYVILNGAGYDGWAAEAALRQPQPSARSSPSPTCWARRRGTTRTSGTARTT